MKLANSRKRLAGNAPSTPTKVLQDWGNQVPGIPSGSGRVWRNSARKLRPRKLIVLRLDSVRER